MFQFYFSCADSFTLRWQSNNLQTLWVPTYSTGKVID